MAKNKSKQNQFQLLSPEKYIRLKARNLPIEVCYVSDDWKDENGAIAEVIVVRRHAGGSYTFGVYVVDTLCLGVKYSVYRFNVSPAEYDDFVKKTASDCGIKISYNEAHNFIYGAIAFAEEFGIKPDKSFAVTQYILEEDTEDIPLIEYKYGRDGRPHLVAETELEASKYISILEESTGGDFGLEILEYGDRGPLAFDDDFDDFDDDEFDDECDYEFEDEGFEGEDDNAEEESKK